VVSFTRATLGVAGTDERGRLIDVRAPLASEMNAIAEAANGSPERLARALFGLGEIIGDDLPKSDAFTVLVVTHLESLFERGALATIRTANRQADR
jgi:mannitol-1-phosphate/altronate dehydrogenase